MKSAYRSAVRTTETDSKSSESVAGKGFPAIHEKFAAPNPIGPCGGHVLEVAIYADEVRLLNPLSDVRAALSENNVNDNIQRHFEDLVLAAGVVFGDWLESMTEDERAEIMALVEDGALPGIRLLLGDERRMPEMAILMRTRGGDIEAVGALQLARAG